MKWINSSYKLIEFFFGGGSCVDIVVNVVMVEVRFGVVVLIEKLVFNIVYEKVGVVGFYFGIYGYFIDLFIIIVSEWKIV